MTKEDPNENTEAIKSATRMVPAVERCIRIIDFLNSYSSRRCTVTKISMELSITKSHCHAILKTLEQFDWVTFDNSTKSYSLSPGLISSSSSLLSSTVLSRIRVHLDQLTKNVGFSSLLTQPRADGKFVMIENFAAARSIEFSYPLGFEFPNDSPAQSRAWAAWQPQEVISQWLEDLAPHKYTASSITDRDLLEREVIATRQRGYSRSVAEQFNTMMALGMPIFGRDGSVIYVFCVIGVVAELQEYEQKIAIAMRETIEAIHKAILSDVPDGFPGRIG